MTAPDQSSPRIRVGTTEMTRQEIVGALEANIGFAKTTVVELVRYVERLPAAPEQAHVLKELQRIQGHLGGNLQQLVRALREDGEAPSK